LNRRIVLQAKCDLDMLIGHSIAVVLTSPSPARRGPSPTENSPLRSAIGRKSEAAGTEFFAIDVAP